MAKELVLVPKSKYEHLLKLTNASGQTEQSGGQVDSSEKMPPPESDIKTNDVSNETTNSSQDSRGESEKKMEEGEGESENKMEKEKPRLYVNKPLSKMPFKKPHLLASSRQKAGSIKTPSKTTKNRRESGRKKSRKEKWINYII